MVGELSVSVPPDCVRVPKLITLPLMVVVELDVIVTGAVYVCVPDVVTFPCNASVPEPVTDKLDVPPFESAPLSVNVCPD